MGISSDLNPQPADYSLKNLKAHDVYVNSEDSMKLYMAFKASPKKVKDLNQSERRILEVALLNVMGKTTIHKNDHYKTETKDINAVLNKLGKGKTEVITKKESSVGGSIRKSFQNLLRFMGFEGEGTRISSDSLKTKLFQATNALSQLRTLQGVLKEKRDELAQLDKNMPSTTSELVEIHKILKNSRNDKNQLHLLINAKIEDKDFLKNNPTLKANLNLLVNFCENDSASQNDVSNVVDAILSKYEKQFKTASEAVSPHDKLMKDIDMLSAQEKKFIELLQIKQSIPADTEPSENVAKLIKDFETKLSKLGKDFNDVGKKDQGSYSDRIAVLKKNAGSLLGSAKAELEKLMKNGKADESQMRFLDESLTKFYRGMKMEGPLTKSLNEIVTNPFSGSAPSVKKMKELNNKISIYIADSNRFVPSLNLKILHAEALRKLINEFKEKSKNFDDIDPNAWYERLNSVDRGVFYKIQLRLDKLDNEINTIKTLRK